MQEVCNTRAEEKPTTITSSQTTTDFQPFNINELSFSNHHYHHDINNNNYQTTANFNKINHSLVTKSSCHNIITNNTQQQEFSSVMVMGNENSSSSSSLLLEEGSGSGSTNNILDNNKKKFSARFNGRTSINNVDDQTKCGRTTTITTPSSTQFSSASLQIVNNNNNTFENDEQDKFAYNNSSSKQQQQYRSLLSRQHYIIIAIITIIIIITIFLTTTTTITRFTTQQNTHHTTKKTTSSNLLHISSLFSIFERTSWNLTRGDSLMQQESSTVGELSEKFTHCRILPVQGDGKAKAIIQWKIISNQTYQNYYPLYNTTQSAKSRLENPNENPIIRMRLVFGETPLEFRTSFKVFGFSKGVTTDEGFNNLGRNLITTTSKSDGDNGDDNTQYRYFFDKQQQSSSRIKILDLMNQPQGTFHAYNLDGNPTFYVAYNNKTRQPYLERYTGTISTTEANRHFPTCNDDMDMAILPIDYGERNVTNANKTGTVDYSTFCTYQQLKYASHTGGIFLTMEKRLHHIVRPKNLINTHTFSEDKLNETLADHKYFVYFMPSTNGGYRNTTSQGQYEYLNTYINRDNVQSYYLAHEVDFSVDFYDKDCDYYVGLYQTSIFTVYFYIRTVRHLIVGVLAILVVGFLFIYRNKQPVKSRLHTAMVSAVVSVIFYVAAVLSDLFTEFNYDAVEYSYYLTLAMLYLVSLIRYTFVRNLYRVIRIVDKMEDTVISTGEFNDDGLVSQYKKKTMHMNFLSRLASKRIYLAAIGSIMVIVNIPTPFFLWLLHTAPTSVFAAVTSAIVYIKLIALILGFVVPGFVALCFDMYINRKWLFYDSCRKIFDCCGDGNISTYMSKVLKKTKKMEEFSCGFTTYFSDYDDPLFYRSEFLLVTSLSLVVGVSTFVLGTIDIPNWRTSLKITMLLIHGTFYFLFDVCYLLLTSGFVVIMQLVLERKKIKTRKTIIDQKATLTGKNPITLLLIRTIGDRTGEGRELLYKFCCKEFSLELLILFERCCKILELLKAQKYKTDPHSMNKKVCDIYNSFVRTRSSLEVTMPYDLKLKISSFVESFSPDDQSVSTESSISDQPRKIYAIFKTEQQSSVSTMDNSGAGAGADNRSIELVNHQTAVFLSDLFDQLKEAALSNLQDSFTRLLATRAFIAYFKKKELEAKTMQQIGFAREDTIELETSNAIVVGAASQQQQQQVFTTTIDLNGTRVITSINATESQQEQLNKQYLEKYENGDEIAISEDSTDPAQEEDEEEDTRHSLDRSE